MLLVILALAAITMPAPLNMLQLRLQLIRRCPPAAECAAAGVVVEMKRETELIWSALGVQLAWIDSLPAAPAECTLADLLIMFEEHPNPFVEGSNREELVLGRTNLPETQCDVGVAHLWMAHIRRHIDAVQMRGLPLISVPPRFTELLLGRALGRTLAHEIGHYLLGAAHASRGLMRPNFTPAEMLEPARPSRYGLDDASRMALSVRRSALTARHCVIAEGSVHGASQR